MSDSSVPSDEEIQSFFLGDTGVNFTNDGPIDVEYTSPDVTVEEEPGPTITEELKDEEFNFGPAESDVKVGDGSCVVCGAPTFRPPGLTKAGHKKRTPKYCDLHNPKLRVSQEGPILTGMEGVAQLKRIQEELADDLRLLGVMAGPLLPVTGVFVFENADPFTTALLKLCKNNQRALRVLHRAASVAPIYEVAKDAAGVFYAMQVDMKKLDPHNTVSQRLGVERAYNTVYPDQVNNVSTNGAPGPPKYAAAS